MLKRQKIAPERVINTLVGFRWRGGGSGGDLGPPSKTEYFMG